MCDEATRFARVALLFSQPLTESKNATTSDCMTAYVTHWEEVFGMPARIRHDPEGALMSTELLGEMSRRGVHLLPTAGEAHWQLGIVERLIGTLFSISERLFKEHRGETPFPE